MPKKTTEKKTKPVQDFVTKIEFNELANLIKGLSDKIESKPANVEVKKSMPEIFNYSDDKTLSEIRKMVDELFGEDFGIQLNYPLFKIIIPIEKSNAGKTHIDFYKQDIRTKALKGGEGIETIKSWLLNVKKNLKQNN